MFTDWVDNFLLLVEETYGDEELPFKTPTCDELRQKFEAGLSEPEALAELAGEWVEVAD